METKIKAATLGLIAVGALETPLLDQYVDKKAVADWIAAQTNQSCMSEGYFPMYKRMAIVIPGVTGLVALIVGLLGDIKRSNGAPLIKPEYQLLALEYGAAATFSALGKMVQVCQNRVDSGLPAFMPKCQQQSQNQQQQQGYTAPPAGAPCMTPGCSGMYREPATA